MKPNFALSLSFDGIRLLHRAAGGWHLLGEASVADPALGTALATLRKVGEDSALGPIKTKLIIPDEQIRYLSIQTPGLDDTARREAARAALDGATPYPVDTLAFDISPDGDTTHIAAVARETLQEAEGFAVQHGFNPVSLVAAGNGADFLGEPFFGPTAHAATLLPPGTEVEADGVRVVIVEKLAEVEVTEAPEPFAVTDTVQETAPAEDAPDAPVDIPPLEEEALLQETPAKEEEPEDSALPQEVRAPQDTPAQEPVPESVPSLEEEEAVLQETPAQEEEPEDSALPQDAPAPQDTSAQEPTSESVPPLEEEAPLQDVQADTDEADDSPHLDESAGSQDAPIQEDAPNGGPPLEEVAFTQDTIVEVDAPDEAPDILTSDSQENDPDAQEHEDSPPEDAPEPTTPPLLGFATRRRQNPTSDVPGLRLGGVSRGDTGAANAPPFGAAMRTADDVTLSAPPRSASDSLRPSDPPLVAATPPVTGPPTKARKGGFLSRRKASQPTPQTSPAGSHEGDRMTRFGARGDGAIGGKSRYLGLFLTAVLIVFLAGVAAWASTFLEDGLSGLFPKRERTLASTLPDDTRASLAADVGATTDLDPEAEADGVIVAALNESLTEDAGLSAEDVAVLDALRDPLPDPVAPEELDADALDARYAVTGIWPKAPDFPTPTGIVEIENLYVTSIDPVSPALDAVALPAAASYATDRQVALVTSPAAAGTNFALDAAGRVIPTLEGALSPDGFTVFLGRPPEVPPVIPARLDDGAEVNPDTTVIAQVRPQPRPDDLVERNERATLGGLSRSELAGLRPRLRPKAPQELQAAELAAIDEAVSEAIDDTETQEPPPPELDAIASLRPETRPRNFARIVARATPAPAPEEEQTSRTASVAPRTVTPSIPSTASVTREATVRNVLNLRRVNLIGVYGTPSDRRALIRLPNGRYKKVEVGDRVDGGRVSAIGDSELRYLKGGRNLVLKMPSG